MTRLQKVLKEGRELAWLGVPVTGMNVVVGGALLDMSMPLLAALFIFLGGCTAGASAITLANVRAYERHLTE